MLMESQAKFCHPQNISGASQQNSKLRNNWSRRGVVSTTAKNIQNWFKKTLFTPWMHTLKKKKLLLLGVKSVKTLVGRWKQTEKVWHHRGLVYHNYFPLFPSCPVLVFAEDKELKKAGRVITSLNQTAVLKSIRDAWRHKLKLNKHTSATLSLFLKVSYSQHDCKLISNI